MRNGRKEGRNSGSLPSNAMIECTLPFIFETECNIMVNDVFNTNKFIYTIATIIKYFC